MSGISEDIYLMKLITLTLEEISSGRHVFPNPLSEPYLYRNYLVPWVREGMEERQRIENERKKLTEQTNAKG